MPSRFSLAARQFLHLAQCQGHVVQHVHVREEIVLLENNTDAGPDVVDLNTRISDVLVLEENLAVVDSLQ